MLSYDHELQELQDLCTVFICLTCIFSEICNTAGMFTIAAVGCGCAFWGSGSLGKSQGRKSVPNLRRTKNFQLENQGSWEFCWLGICVEISPEAVTLGLSYGDSYRVCVWLLGLQHSEDWPDHSKNTPEPKDPCIQQL